MASQITTLCFGRDDEDSMFTKKISRLYQERCIGLRIRNVAMKRGLTVAANNSLPQKHKAINSNIAENIKK